MNILDIWDIKKTSGKIVYNPGYGYREVPDRETAIELSGLPEVLGIYDNVGVFHPECVELLRQIRDAKKSSTWIRTDYRKDWKDPERYIHTELPELTWSTEKEVPTSDYADADFNGQRYVAQMADCDWCGANLDEASEDKEALALHPQAVQRSVGDFWNEIAED